MVSSRTVDLRLERQSESDITFSAVIKDEHPLMQEFLESKKVKVSNQVMDDMMGTSQAAMVSVFLPFKARDALVSYMWIVL